MRMGDVNMYLFAALVIGVFASLIVAVRMLQPLVRAKVGEAEFDRLMMRASIIVHKLEQVGERLGYDGARKKQLAVVGLRKFAEAVGIEVTDELLEDVIEACVYLMNTQKPVVLSAEIGEAEG
jgi:hypothetical protein